MTLIDTETEDIFADLVLTPQQIVEMRQQDYTNASQWSTYVDLNLPELDPDEQYQIKLKENRQKYRLTCGNLWFGKWHPKDIKHRMRIKFCKQRGCPICDARRKQQAHDRLDNLHGSSIVTLKPEQEADFKKNLSKDDYMRIPRSDGTISFILNTDHADGQLLAGDVKELLAQDIVNVTGQRVTGSLGKPVTVNKSEEPASLEDEINNLFEDDIKTQNHSITFNSESKLKSIKEIDEEVYRRLGKIEFEHNIQMLQWLMSELERQTEIVCIDNKIEYRQLSIETISVDVDEVEWSDFKRRVEKAQLT